MEKIVGKYKEFSEYLDGIDLSKVEDNYTREEIKNIIQEIQDVKLRYITLELGKIEEKMKEEEYPEILGVHHFPIIKEITFLTDKQKLELDKYLVRFRVATYLSKTGLYRIVYEKADQLLEWLEDKGVVEVGYLLSCFKCREDNIGKLTKEEKDLFEEYFNKYQETKGYDYYEKMEELTRGYCTECDSSLDEMLDYGIGKPYYEPIYKIIMERDTTYDNV